MNKNDDVNNSPTVYLNTKIHWSINVFTVQQLKKALIVTYKYRIHYIVLNGMQMLLYWSWDWNNKSLII